MIRSTTGQAVISERDFTAEFRVSEEVKMAEGGQISSFSTIL
jgi:hypothetical protein